MVALIFTAAVPVSSLATKPDKKNIPESYIITQVVEPDVNDIHYEDGVYPLYAGQRTLVGQIEVSRVGSNLEIKFTVDPGYYMTSCAVDIAQVWSDLPHSNGGLIPGQFEVKSGTILDDECTLTIPLGSLSGRICLAAHADVVGGLDGLRYYFESIEPTSTIVSTPDDYPAYMAVDLDPYSPSPIYQGWCANLGITINPGTIYNVQTFLSTDSIPLGVIDHPENLPMVNWILNRDWVGQMANDGQLFWYGDVQRAIWTLIDNGPLPPGGNQAHIDQILADAAGHNDFVPGPNDVVAIILVPVDASGNLIGQPVLLTWEMPGFSGSQTAWAGEYFDIPTDTLKHAYPGSSWSAYVHYIVSA